MSRRQTLVQLSAELVAELDARAGRDNVSRSHVIRAAVEEYLASDRERALDAAIVDGYTRFPPGELDDLAEAAARRAIAGEPW